MSFGIAADTSFGAVERPGAGGDEPAAGGAAALAATLSSATDGDVGLQWSTSALLEADAPAVSPAGAGPPPEEFCTRGGFLQKECGATRKLAKRKWGQRWVALQPTILAYFKTADLTGPSTTVPPSFSPPRSSVGPFRVVVWRRLGGSRRLFGMCWHNISIVAKDSLAAIRSHTECTRDCVDEGWRTRFQPGEAARGY
jgi:hypothetical protein